MKTLETLSYLFEKTRASFNDEGRGKFWVAARKKALRRDKWTCQVCGKRNLMLHVHHICGWAWFPLLRFELSNLVTLCKSCHKRFHKFNGGTDKKCDEKDYARWLKSKSRSSSLVPLWMYVIVFIVLSCVLFKIW